MQFVPTSEQTQLKDSARRFVEKTYLPAGRKKALASDVGFEAEHWATFAELGWLAIGLPENAGGFGGTAFDSAVVAEELGRGLVLEPFTAVAVLAAQTLAELAPEREDILSGLATGESKPVLAHSEAAARGEVAFVETTAKVNKDGSYTLNGTKSAVLGGPVADLFLVSARTSGAPNDVNGITLFAIPANAPGVTHQHYRTVDDRGATNLILKDAVVTADAVIGSVNGAFPAILRATDYAMVIGSAEALGAMHAALDLTRSYLLTRKQYGVLIGTFQALRHRVADMFIETEQARSIVLKGLAALDDPDPVERTRWASATKARVAQAGKYVTGNAIQLHGGIGVTDEFIVGHYFKRIEVFNLMLGTSHDHLERFSKLSGLEK